MINLSKLINKVVVKKAYGYKYHSFSSHSKKMFVSKDVNIKDMLIGVQLLNNITLNTEEDFVLALSTLNLLGSGAKQQKGEVKDNNFIYTKRRYFLFNIIASAIINNVDIKINSGVDEFNNSQKTTMVNIGNVQFSYHIDCEPILNYCEKNNLNIVDRTIMWNKNFKMQNGGKELFEFCLHLKNTSNTLTNERPLDYVNFLRKVYYLDENKITEDLNATKTKFKAEDFVFSLEKGNINER